MEYQRKQEFHGDYGAITSSAGANPSLMYEVFFDENIH